MTKPETVALVDARNVLRSRWPNIPEEELVELARAWGSRAGVRPVLVFDGRAPVAASAEVDVVGTRGEQADDWIAREAARLGAAGETYWLVTSDRGLRGRASKGAARVLGGGAFAAELEEL